MCVECLSGWTQDILDGKGPLWKITGAASPTLLKLQGFLIIHSSCCNTNLLDSWWAINNSKHCASSGSELELCMPIAYQHQLTFIITSHTQNKFPIAFNQHNKVVYIILHLFLIIMALLLVVNLFILTPTNCCYWLWQLISASTTSASSC